MRIRFGLGVFVVILASFGAAGCNRSVRNLGNRSHDSWGPITVAADQYFMMGDNRRNSSDSRHWGLVKRDAIWGKVDR